MREALSSEKPHRAYQVVPYNPEWHDRFDNEANIIRNILGDQVLALHHIGSTAVVGLMAKPEIDMMAVVQDLAAIDELNENFATAGYEAKGDYSHIDEKYFTKELNGERLYNLHIKKIKRYWSQLTGIPLKNFGKCFIKPKGTGHRTNILPNGIIKIRVRGIGTEDLRHRILAWSEKIYELSEGYR